MKTLKKLNFGLRQNLHRYYWSLRRPLLSVVSVSIAVLALASSTSQSRGDVISFEFGSLDAYSLTELNFSDVLGLFDSNLGTLTGATLTLSDAYTSETTLNNLSGQEQTGRFQSTLQSFWSSSLTAVNDQITDADPDDKLLIDTGIFNLDANGSASFGPVESSFTQSYDLAAYLGSLQQAGGGTFTVNLQTLTTSAVQGGGGNIDWDQDTAGARYGKITYTYDITPVPEPSSALLLGITGMLMIFRRRRSLFAQQQQRRR